jgi:hypothetical protein
LPNVQTAKNVAENALSTIGAFPASQSAPDPGELKKTLQWLEMLLSYQSGIRPIAGFWQIFDIPLEANVGDYNMADYASKRGVIHVFSAALVGVNSDPDFLDFVYEDDAVLENLSATGRPSRVSVTKDREMMLKVYPTPTQVEQDAGLVIRVRVQTYHDTIDDEGIADEDINLRPAWYLWLTKRLAYEIGCGPVRRLAEGELKRLEDDAHKLENALLARDGQYSSPRMPVTEPMAGSIDGCWSSEYRTRRTGYVKQ